MLEVAGILSSSIYIASTILLVLALLGGEELLRTWVKAIPSITRTTFMRDCGARILPRSFA